jgi:hypothetical protein
LLVYAVGTSPSSVKSGVLTISRLLPVYPDQRLRARRHVSKVPIDDMKREA